MMEQPRLPVLKLDLQKKTTYDPAPLLLTQGDKGYIQPFVIINGLEQYAVTADVLGFRAMKPDRTFIEIENEPERFSNVDGVWQFTLPDELTQSVGTVSGAYFLVTNGSTVVASTTKFNYQISQKWSEEEQSNNYVTKLEELGKKLQDYVNAGAQTITVLNDYGEEAKTSLSDKLVALTSEVTTWKTTTTTAVDKVLADEKTALQKAQSDWNSEYNKVVAYYANMAVEWTAKKASYDKLVADEIAKMETAKTSAINDFTNKSSAKLTEVSNSLADLETKKTAALDKVASDATAKIANIQSQADAKLASIQKDWNTLKTSLNAEIQALADKVVATDGKADEIRTRLDELVAQLDSIDIVSVKNAVDKATADVAELRERKTYLHTAYSWSADGTDRFMTVYPGENLWSDKKAVIYTILGSNGLPHKSTAPDAAMIDPVTVPSTATKLVLTIYNPNKVVNTLNGAKPSFFKGDTYLGIQDYFRLTGDMVQKEEWSIPAGATKAYLGTMLGAANAKSLDFSIKTKYEFDTTTPYTPSTLDDPEGAYPSYLGTYTDYIAEDSTDPAKYEWIPIPRPNEKNVLKVEGKMPDNFGNVSIPQIAQNVLDIKNLATKNDSQDVTISKLAKSVNGIKPDASGNISLPQPDLTPYALKTQLPNLSTYATTTAMNTAITTAKTAMATDAQTKANTALSSAKSYADTKKTEAQSYTDSKLSGVLKSWTGTQAQYDSLATKDPNTQYLILEVV